MATYTEDYPIAEIESKLEFNEDAFSFSGETNTGSGLDANEVLKRWNENIENIKTSVQQIFSK